jgi:hypothetical protein
MPLTQRTAQILSTKTQELQQIQWSIGESNTDLGFSNLACSCCISAWNDIKDSYSEFKDLTIECYPSDINIKFIQETSVVYQGKIELKSKKGVKTVRGSTIGNLDINQPIIFCFRNDSNGFEFRYDQYYNTIGESEFDTFQDRTPRPTVNFQKMKDIHTPAQYVYKEKNHWVSYYSKCSLNRIDNNKSSSWQDDLVIDIRKEIIQKLKDKIEKNDKEFYTKSELLLLLQKTILNI